MDTDGSGSICFDELCSRLRRLDVNPPIHITMTDFDAVTQNGKLCGKGGEMGPGEFERAMRLQLRLYHQVLSRPGQNQASLRECSLLAQTCSGSPDDPRAWQKHASDDLACLLPPTEPQRIPQMQRACAKQGLKSGLIASSHRSATNTADATVATCNACAKQV